MGLKDKIGEALPVVIATIFLGTFVGVLLRIALEHRRTAPAQVYGDFIRDLRDDYTRAVYVAMQPAPSHVSHSLVSVNVDQPLTVVTWTRRKQVPDFQKTAPKDTWVTVVPYLKAFCQQYVNTHGTDPGQLQLRLQQRLGLPTSSDYDSFVELTLDPKDVTKFFRPCGDPSTDTKTCDPASPPKPYEIRDKLKNVNLANPKDVEQFWLLANYYQSFASRDQYPWTSLGYTFDWAPKDEGSDDFVRWGESEFVITKGTPVHFISATDTASYCTSP